MAESKERERARHDIDGLEKAIKRIVTQDAKDRARRVLGLARIGLSVKYPN